MIENFSNPPEGNSFEAVVPLLVSQSVIEQLFRWRYTLLSYAPININPVWGECGQGVGISQILKFFDQIPQGGRRKVNQSVKKAPTPGEKI